MMFKVKLHGSHSILLVLKSLIFLQSANMRRLQSDFSEDTDTTITNGDNRKSDLEELTHYFNKWLFSNRFIEFLNEK